MPSDAMRTLDSVRPARYPELCLDLSGQGLGRLHDRVPAEAQQPALELGRVGQLERGDHAVLLAARTVLQDLLAGVPGVLADVGRRPAREPHLDRLDLF